MKPTVELLLASLVFVLEWPINSCLSLLNAQMANQGNAYASMLGASPYLYSNDLLGKNQNLLLASQMNNLGLMGGVGANTLGAGFARGLNYGLNKYNPDLANRRSVGARVNNNELRRKYFEDKERAAATKNEKNNIQNDEEAANAKKPKIGQVKKLSIKKKLRVNQAEEEEMPRMAKKNQQTMDEKKNEEVENSIDETATEVESESFEKKDRSREEKEDEREREESPLSQLEKDAREDEDSARRGEIQKQDTGNVKKLSFRAPIRGTAMHGQSMHPSDVHSMAHRPPSDRFMHESNFQPGPSAGYQMPDSTIDSIHPEENDRYEDQVIDPEQAEAKLDSLLVGLLAANDDKLIKNVNTINLKDEISHQSAQNTEVKSESSKNLNVKKTPLSAKGKKYGSSKFNSLIVISNTNTNNNLAETSDSQYSADHVAEFLSYHKDKTVFDLVNQNVTELMLKHFQKDKENIDNFLKTNEYSHNLKASIPKYSVIDNREQANEPSNKTESTVTLKNSGERKHERLNNDLTYSYIPYGNGGVLVINNSNKNRNEKIKRILSGEGVNIYNPSGGIELPMTKEEIDELLNESVVVNNENSNSNLL